MSIAVRSGMTRKTKARCSLFSEGRLEALPYDASSFWHSAWSFFKWRLVLASM
jgi:hypothetical protein